MKRLLILTILACATIWLNCNNSTNYDQQIADLQAKIETKADKEDVGNIEQDIREINTDFGEFELTFNEKSAHDDSMDLHFIDKLDTICYHLKKLGKDSVIVNWHDSIAYNITYIDSLECFITLYLEYNSGHNRVEIYWNANSEPDLMCYNIYYGMESGNYSHIYSSVRNDTTLTLNSLGMWYFTVTAIDSSYNESGKSNEVSYDCIEMRY